jgi:hypothetical protein
LDCVHTCLLISFEQANHASALTALIQITCLADYECGAGAWTYPSQHPATSRKKRRLYPRHSPLREVANATFMWIVALTGSVGRLLEAPPCRLPVAALPVPGLVDLIGGSGAGGAQL